MRYHSSSRSFARELGRGPEMALRESRECRLNRARVPEFSRFFTIFSEYTEAGFRAAAACTRKPFTSTNEDRSRSAYKKARGNVGKIKCRGEKERKKQEMCRGCGGGFFFFAGFSFSRTRRRSLRQEDRRRGRVSSSETLFQEHTTTSRLCSVVTGDLLVTDFECRRCARL